MIAREAARLTCQRFAGGRRSSRGEGRAAGVEVAAVEGLVLVRATAHQCHVR